MAIDYIRKNYHREVFWGIFLQIAGGLLHPLQNFPLINLLGWLITLAGTALLLAGFAFYAKSKGRNPAWCLLALLSIIGWIVIILLKDKSSAVVSSRIS